MNKVKIDEISRVVNICDIYGKKRYSVNLDTYFVENNTVQLYVVSVIDLTTPEQTIVNIVRDIQTYFNAQYIFNENVKNYSLAVDLETKHIQQIDVYKSKIGYTQARCCRNCNYAHLTVCPFTQQLKANCHNTENFENQDIKPIVELTNVCDNFQFRQI